MPRSPTASAKGDLDSADTEKPMVDEEEDDEDEVLETSENGRWQKINTPVTRDVPGIDAAYLAMDTDDGVEVVWNEVLYSNRKVVKGGVGKERLVKILQRLTEVKHNNIVNFIEFWHDKVIHQDRLVFITEYITSGSMLHFLMRAKQTKKLTAVSLKMWRRWCRQILSALSYLHKSEIVHGNLSLASIFIQHDGLVKIGSVSPDAIHTHVKTYMMRKGMPFMHYAAPELSREQTIQCPADIYAFGICALEMLNLDLFGNGENKQVLLNREAIERALDHLDPRCQQFIRECLHENPAKRPNAACLLKHPVLQEVFSLKVLSALVLRSREKIESLIENRESEESLNQDREVATVVPANSANVLWKASQVKRLDLDKLFEDISQDIVYEPVMPKTLQKKVSNDSSEVSVPLNSSSSQRNSNVFYEREKRNIQRITKCFVSREGEKSELILCLTLDDKLERELRSELKEDDDGESLALDLVVNGLISERDMKAVAKEIQQQLN